MTVNVLKDIRNRGLVAALVFRPRRGRVDWVAVAITVAFVAIVAGAWLTFAALQGVRS